MGREGDGEGGAYIRLAFYGNVSTVILYETVADRQAETDPFDAVFGGEKGIKNSVYVFGMDALAGVIDIDADGLVFSAGGYGKRSAVGHGISGVCDHIQENLPELIDAGMDFSQILPYIANDFNIVFAKLFFMQY